MAGLGRDQPALDFLRKASVVRDSRRADEGASLRPSTGEGAVVDADRQELARRLFALASEVAEAAMEATIAGQSPRLDDAGCEQVAAALRDAAHGLTSLAEAAFVIARTGAAGRALAGR